VNLAALRKEPEELEQAGYGACRVELYPLESEDETTGKYALDFNGVGYEAYDIDVPDPPGEAS
jgi:hypothetical protein